MAIVRASSKYQIAIPKIIRDRLKIKPGQKLDVSEVDGAILLTPIPADPIDFLFGIFEGEPSVSRELIEERKRDLKHE